MIIDGQNQREPEEKEKKYTQNVMKGKGISQWKKGGESTSKMH